MNSHINIHRGRGRGRGEGSGRNIRRRVSKRGGLAKRGGVLRGENGGGIEIIVVVEDNILHEFLTFEH